MKLDFKLGKLKGLWVLKYIKMVSNQLIPYSKWSAIVSVRLEFGENTFQFVVFLPICKFAGN